MKNHTIVILISFLLLSSPIANSQESLLQLTMESDNGKYKVGEEIQLHCTVKNVSDTIVAFYPYLPREVSMKDMVDSACVQELAQTMEWHDSLVTLKPDEIFKYTLKGEIRREKGSISDAYTEGTRRRSTYFGTYYKEVYGIFVSFSGNGYYLRENYGKYKITSCFMDANMLIASSPKDSKDLNINLKDKWHGKLISNTIVIELTK
jgi:hypothetical protein